MSTIIQGSPEWFAQRLGKVTASRIADLMAKTKSGYAASRANYMAQLVAERLTGTQQESYTNAAMQWGIDTEPHARDAYTFRTDNEIVECAFIEHPNIAECGASPDGLVGDDGLVEIKCPNTATHIDTLLSKTIPSKYILQMQWQLACTGRQWCDYVSFDPRMPEHMRLFVQRLPRDHDKIMEISGEVMAFLIDVNRQVEALKAAYDRAEAA